MSSSYDGEKKRISSLALRATSHAWSCSDTTTPRAVVVSRDGSGKGKLRVRSHSVLKHRFFLLAVAASCLPGIGALHNVVQADHLPWPFTPLFQRIGLTPNATIQINLSTKISSPNAYVLFFNEAQWIASLPHLVHINGLPSTYLPCEWRASLAHPLDAVHRIRAHESGRYWLGIIQGHPKAVQGLSGEVGFLNSGGDQLPSTHRDISKAIFWVAWLSFGSCTILFSLMVLRRRATSRLHGLIFLDLLIKFLALLLHHQDILLISKNGEQSVGYHVFSALLRQVQSILEVVVFYVIGLGWKVTRPHLRTSEWAFASTISVLSFFLGAFEVACSTFMACTGQSYLLTQFTLHSLCFLVVIVATNFNIFQLQRQITEALATPDTGKLYTKHRSYCWFRGFFLFFVIIPSITNFLNLHVLSWDELWVLILVKEFSLWLVHLAVLLLFRPGNQQLLVFELAVVDSSESETSDQE